MPRKKREKAHSHMYHVFARGVNRQPIFEDDQDNYYFMRLLRKMTADDKCKIYAWCLMGNHFHLLVKEEEGHPLGELMHSLGVSYAKYFNSKYERSGHLFQDRFRSVPILDTRQLLTEIMYIHMNPVKAGLCRDPGDYAMSSYNEYLQSGGKINMLQNVQLIADTSHVLSIVGIDWLMNFTGECDLTNDDDTYFYHSRMNDDTARAIMRQCCSCGTSAEFQKLDKADRDKAMIDMAGARVKFRQIARITGYSDALVRRVVDSAEEGEF